MALARDVGEGPPGPDAGSGRGLPPGSSGSPLFTAGPSVLRTFHQALGLLSLCLSVLQSVCPSLAVSVYLLSL